MELWTILQETWAVRALIASSLVGIMCGLLGCFIVLRNMSLVGDALSHAILPGVVGAYLVVGYSALGFFTGAVVAGLITAVAITWIQQRVKTKNDAAVGIVFTAMFSLGVIGISRISRNDGVHLDLKDFLFGNVLGVADTDLWLTGLVCGFVILSIVVFYRYLFASTFQPVVSETMGISVKLLHYYLMLLLSFAVVASLQTVGVILVVAMLITPAATALLLSKRLERVLVIAAGVGLASAILGLLLAIIWETTPGPAMAIVATGIYLLTVILAPERGLVAKARRRRSLRFRIQREDILKLVYREGENITAQRIREKLDLGQQQWKNHLAQLQRLELFERGDIRLTDKGKALARRLVRAHRLWETYLADQMGLSTEQIHDDAERFEHLLTDELLDAVDAELGFPTLDPHGSPIPSKPLVYARTLAQLAPGTGFRLASRQFADDVTARLWELGLVPGANFRVEDRDETGIRITGPTGIHRLAPELAARIAIDPLTPPTVGEGK